jgi:hypothetical protein
MIEPHEAALRIEKILGRCANATQEARRATATPFSVAKMHACMIYKPMLHKCGKTEGCRRIGGEVSSMHRTGRIEDDDGTIDLLDDGLDRGTRMTAAVMR